MKKPPLAHMRNFAGRWERYTAMDDRMNNPPRQILQATSGQILRKCAHGRRSGNRCMTRVSRKLPQSVRNELDHIAGDRIVVATVLAVTLDNVAQFQNNGLGFDEGKITTGQPAPPPRECGTHSRRNLDGSEEKRKDLPKETRGI